MEAKRPIYATMSKEAVNFLRINFAGDLPFDGFRAEGDVILTVGAPEGFGPEIMEDLSSHRDYKILHRDEKTYIIGKTEAALAGAIEFIKQNGYPENDITYCRPFDKNKTVFNIRDYGAKGDGVTDDTLAITYAIADCAAVCGTVTVPPGKYITGQQKLYPEMTLRADDAWQYASRPGGTELILRDGDAECMLDLTDAYGTTLHGLVLNGRNMGDEVHGILIRDFSHDTTLTVDSCKIGCFSGDGIRFLRAGCFSIRHSQIHLNRGSGLRANAWDGFLLDNWFSGNGHYGVYAADNDCNSAYTFTSNRIEWNKFGGVRIDRGDKWNITGNYFDRNYGPGLEIGYHNYTGHCTVTGNFFNRNGVSQGMNFYSEHQKSHIWCKNANNLTITGNSFLRGWDDNGAGDYCPDFVAVFKNCTQTVFTANSTDNDSITVDGGGTVTVCGNV